MICDPQKIFVAQIIYDFLNDKIVTKNQIYAKESRLLADDGFIMEQPTDVTGVEIQLLKQELYLSRDYKVALEFLELVYYALVATALDASQIKFKTVISTAYKSFKITSLTSADPLSKAIESFTQSTTSTLTVLFTSLICNNVEQTVVYDTLNKPITLKTWLAALYIYTYLPQVCFDTYTKNMTVAIALSGFTGDSFSSVLKNHSYPYIAGLLSQFGIIQARADVANSGYMILARDHGHKFILPLNMEKDNYLPYQSSSFIKSRTKLNIAGESPS